MNSCSVIIKISKNICKSNKLITNHRDIRPRVIRLTQCKNFSSNHPSYSYDKQANTSPNDLVKSDFKEFLEKEYPDHFSDGKFISRISYIDFIDEALHRMKELGKERDLNAYKELLKVFPPGKYHPKSNWDLGLFHAPQQLCALRILNQMDLNGVIPDKEVERIVVDRFSIHSDVWLKCARMNFWFMKFRNLDPTPLPEVIPKQTHQLAKIALVRMLEDPKSVVTVTNTSSLPDVKDKTWVVYSQSPTQKNIINRLADDSLLYIEDAGLAYVQDKYLSYYMLKIYDDEETIKMKRMDPEPDFNYNTMKMKFYGKPIREKLRELEEMHYDGTGYVLALGFTGTSSPDSILSWLKILQLRNPRLKKMRIMFKLEKPTLELTRANVGSGGTHPQDEQKAKN